MNRLESFEYPLLGTVNLRYYPDAAAKLREPLLSIQLKVPSTNWHVTGKRPFTWDFVPPTQDRRYAVIRLAVVRDATLVVRQPTQSLTYDEKNPFLEVYRIQNPGLLCSDLQAVFPEPLQGRTLRWLEGSDPLDEPPPIPIRTASRATAVIQPSPRGVYIFSERGDWDFELLVPADEPAVAIYDVGGPQLPSGFVIRVIRTENTQLKVRRTRDIAKGKSPVAVLERIVDSPDQVPPQGAYLNPEHYRFQQYEDYEDSLTPRTRAVALASDVGIGFIPVIGDIYDISQFALAAITGRNFWGEKVHETELLMLGLTALLPTVLGATPAVLRASARISKANPRFAKVLDPIVQRAMAVRVDPRLAQTVRGLSEEDQHRLLDLAAAVAEGRMASRAALATVAESLQRGFLELADELRLHQTLLREYEELLSDPLVTEALRGLGAAEPRSRAALRAFRAGALDLGQALAVLPEPVRAALFDFHELAKVRRVFSSAFDELLVEPLASGFRLYRSRGNSGSAVQWALRQTRPPYRPVLDQFLGADYVRTLNRLIERGHIPRVDEAAKQFYERVQGVADFYRDHRKLTQGRGNLFEVDHLLEKRFFKSPLVENVVDESDMFAFIVPKNPAVAKELPMQVGYAHSEKTRMLRELIPHGSEDLFNLQEWWDAHLFTFKRLGVPENLLKRLEGTFDDLKQSVKQDVQYRYDQTEDLFLAAKGWGQRGGTGVLRVPATLPAP